MFQFTSLQHLLGRLTQTLSMTCAKFTPGVTLPAKMFVDLINAPHVILVIFLVFRVDGVELAGCTGGGKERAVEEGREAGQGAGEGRGRDVEEVVGVVDAGEGIGAAVVFGQILWND
jgi:hypothetical protein